MLNIHSHLCLDCKLTFGSACFSWRYLSSLTAKASNAAWKNEIVCNHWSATGTVFLLISKPVNRRL